MQRRWRMVTAGTALTLVAVAGAALALSRPAETTASDGRNVSLEVVENFKVIGHDPLLGRGMNSAGAIYGDYMYVGSRTDGSQGHENAGVLVVDISNPADPDVVGQIGLPNHAKPGESSRELRVWPEQGLLLVLSISCDAPTHGCTSPAAQPFVRFYDVRGDKAAAPELVASYSVGRMVHEMFLWTDGPDRALLYMSSWKNGAAGADLWVTDISRAREGVTPVIAEWNGNQRFTAAYRNANVVRLHSMGLNEDGTRTYIAYQGAGMFVLDTSQVAAGVPNPVINLLTPVGQQPSWGNPGAHSAVKVPGRDLVLTTDEVYGNRPGGGFQSRGCPWGWTRLIDISDESRPVVVGEYKLEQNTPEYCSSPLGQDPLYTWYTSYSAHNPTLHDDLAFITWHSGGFHAISYADPTAPVRTGFFSPEPLESVVTEDPALSSGTPKVVMWSYPIIRDGLIYVVDIRNGLYVLKYTGEGAKEVGKVNFLEGNSNVALLEWSGFLATFEDAPFLNPAHSSGTQTFWFRLGDDLGLDVLDDPPAARPIDCSTFAPLGALEPVAGGADPFGFQASTERYYVRWQTTAAVRGTCQELVLSLRDGSTHSAYLQFVK